MIRAAVRWARAKRRSFARSLPRHFHQGRSLDPRRGKYLRARPRIPNQILASLQIENREHLVSDLGRPCEQGAGEEQRARIARGKVLFCREKYEAIGGWLVSYPEKQGAFAPTGPRELRTTIIYFSHFLI